MNTAAKNTHAYTYSAQRVSLAAKTVRVEADITTGVHTFSIIGLPDKAVDEARGRVSAAIKHAGFMPPNRHNQKVTISLSPGELRKTGALFDVSIALTYLLANRNIEFNPEKKMFVGELTLNGHLHPAGGILPLLQHAREHGFEEVYIPAANSEEAALIDGITIFTCETLDDIINHLQGKQHLTPTARTYEPPRAPDAHSLFSSVKGQESVKRALTVAGAGGHNVALFGPPGTGKTLLAKSLISILPTLTKDECVEVTALHSIAGTHKEGILYTPPFRNPHHTSSYTSIIGGGTPIRPGEVSLAHRGVLFLDEFPEFDRRVIESLREPLEEHAVTVTRASGVVSFPASCILIIAFNLCPCGKTGTDEACTCTPAARATYRKKLTGPIVDRVDIWVAVEATAFEELEKISKDAVEREERIRDTVATARKRQQERYAGTPIKSNSEVDSSSIDRYIPLSQEVSATLRDIATKMSLSPRGYHRTIKCARTIADIEGADTVSTQHIMEAVSYRTPPIF